LEPSLNDPSVLASRHAEAVSPHLDDIRRFGMRIARPTIMCMLLIAALAQSKSAPQ
jgi:hypothetical protein